MTSYSVFVLALLGGCMVVDPQPEAICTLEARAGVVLRIVDQESGAPLASGSTIVAKNRASVDTLRIPETPGPEPVPEVGILHERPGTYAVEVLREGYEPWSRSGVVVEQGECHVHTVHLLVELEERSE